MKTSITYSIYVYVDVTFVASRIRAFFVSIAVVSTTVVVVALAFVASATASVVVVVVVVAAAAVVVVAAAVATAVETVTPWSHALAVCRAIHPIFRGYKILYDYEPFSCLIRACSRSPLATDSHFLRTLEEEEAL